MTAQYGLLVIATIACLAEVTNGKPPRQMIGGQRAAAGEFPYQALMLINGKTMCGGAIISKRHILTAAHCVAGVVTAPYENLAIVTGSTSAKAGHKHRVKSVLYHRSYSTSSQSSPNDIAIIALAGEIKFDAYQHSVPLARAATRTGVIATVTGWGWNRAGSHTTMDDLEKIQVTTLTAAECQKYLANSAILYTHQICTSGKPGKGICQGDSGGPLVSNGQLIGIVSYNIPCGRGYPDVYSSVYHYADWIQQVMEMA